MSIRYLMGFNTTDLPPNFNDRFRSIFRIGIFAGGNVEQTSALQVGVTPFVAVTCDGGVVRDDLDTQYLTVPPNKPDGVYICLLAKYRDFDEPQLEWKVVEPSCLSACDNADCFIIFALVHTGSSNITMIEKYGPHRLDPCNKEDLHTWPTLSSLPSFVDGLVRGECAFVIETRMFYWWDGNQWLPINCGSKTIVIVSVVAGTVDVDASSGDIFIVDLTGPTTFNAPTNPVNGKTIEFWIYSSIQYPMSWNPIYQGTQTTIPLISTGSGRGDADRVFFEYQPAHGFSGAHWAATYRDTDNVAIGIGAQTPDGYGNVSIGRGATTSLAVYGATVIGQWSSIGAASIYSVAIGGSTVGDFASNSVAIGSVIVDGGASGSVAIGVGITVYPGAYSSVVIGQGSSTTTSHSLLVGFNNAVIDTSTLAVNNTIVGSDNSVDTGASHNTIIGNTNLAEAGADNNTIIGNNHHLDSDADHNFVGGMYSYLRDGGTEYNIAIGMGTGTAFDPAPGAQDPPGDIVQLQQNAARSVVIGSKILVEAGSTNTFSIGHNVWVTNGSGHSIAIGETLLIQESTNSIAIGGCYNGHMLNYDTRQRLYIHNSIDCVAIGHNISVVDMGQLTTPGGGYADAASVALGKGISLNGSYGSGIFGSNFAAGSAISFNTTSATVGIGVNIAIGTATVAVSYGVGIGGSVNIYGDRGIAIGKSAAISTSATANGILTADAIAIGSGTTVSDRSSSSIVIGTGANTLGIANDTIAIGSVARVTGSYAIAIGYHAAAGANKCVIGGSSLSILEALNEFTINAYDPEVTTSSLESFKVKYGVDGNSDSSGDPAVAGVAHKTNVLVRLSSEYAGGLRRVYAWDGGDITGLAAAFPNARVLFLAN